MSSMSFRRPFTSVERSPTSFERFQNTVGGYPTHLTGTSKILEWLSLLLLLSSPLINLSPIRQSPELIQKSEGPLSGSQSSLVGSIRGGSPSPGAMSSRWRRSSKPQGSYPAVGQEGGVHCRIDDQFYDKVIGACSECSDICKPNLDPTNCMVMCSKYYRDRLLNTTPLSAGTNYRQSNLESRQIPDTEKSSEDTVRENNKMAPANKSPITDNTRDRSQILSGIDHQVSAPTHFMKISLITVASCLAIVLLVTLIYFTVTRWCKNNEKCRKHIKKDSNKEMYPKLLYQRSHKNLAVQEIEVPSKVGYLCTSMDSPLVHTEKLPKSSTSYPVQPFGAKLEDFQANIHLHRPHNFDQFKVSEPPPDLGHRRSMSGYENDKGRKNPVGVLHDSGAELRIDLCDSIELTNPPLSSLCTEHY